MFTDEQVKVLVGYSGALSSTGAAGGVTDKGCAIDTRGFKEVMAVLTCGQANGTAGNGIKAAVLIEESAVIDGTTTAWSTIANGKINGTMSLSGQLVMGTTIFAVDKAYERLDDVNRKRYIRAAVQVVGTAGLSICPVGVDIILGGADDTNYINSEATKSITDTNSDGTTGNGSYNTYV